MPNFTIRFLDESEFPLWDNLVDESPNGTLFHKSIWLRASGKSFVIYGCFRGGELCAGVPFSCHARFGIKRACHPTLTPYLGVLFKQNNDKYVTRISHEKDINREIARRLKRDFHHITFKCTPGVTDFQPYMREGFSVGIRYTYKVNLNRSLEDIWKSMAAGRRSDIVKAGKDGISAIHSDDFEQTFDLVDKTFVRQDLIAGFKSRACSYNEILRKKNQCKSFLAKDRNGDLIASAYIVWDNRRSYYLLGGYDSYKSHRGGSALAIWEAIRFSKEELGLKEFDFEGSLIPPVELFFRKFGGEQIPYFSVSWTKPYLNMPRLLNRAWEEILSRV